MLHTSELQKEDGTEAYRSALLKETAVLRWYSLGRPKLDALMPEAFAAQRTNGKLRRSYNACGCNWSAGFAVVAIAVCTVFSIAGFWGYLTAINPAPTIWTKIGFVIAALVTGKILGLEVARHKTRSFLKSGKRLFAGDRTFQDFEY